MDLTLCFENPFNIIIISYFPFVYSFLKTVCFRRYTVCFFYNIVTKLAFFIFYGPGGYCTNDLDLPDWQVL
jgi:hypothetical protein